MYLGIDFAWFCIVPCSDFLGQILPVLELLLSVDLYGVWLTALDATKVCIYYFLKRKIFLTLLLLFFSVADNSRSFFWDGFLR